MIGDRVGVNNNPYRYFYGKQMISLKSIDTREIRKACFLNRPFGEAMSVEDEGSRANESLIKILTVQKTVQRNGPRVNERRPSSATTAT
jgi:hypothetical protein